MDISIRASVRRPNTRIPESVRGYILRDYKRGDLVSVIAARHRVTAGFVSSLAKKAGVLRRSFDATAKRRIIEALDGTIIPMLRDYRTIKQISQAMGCPPTTLRTVLSSVGVSTARYRDAGVLSTAGLLAAESEEAAQKVRDCARDHGPDRAFCLASKLRDEMMEDSKSWLPFSSTAKADEVAREHVARLDHRDQIAKDCYDLMTRNERIAFERNVLGFALRYVGGRYHLSAERIRSICEDPNFSADKIADRVNRLLDAKSSASANE